MTTSLLSLSGGLVKSVGRAVIISYVRQRMHFVWPWMPVQLVGRQVKGAKRDHDVTHVESVLHGAVRLLVALTYQVPVEDEEHAGYDLQRCCSTHVL